MDSWSQEHPWESGLPFPFVLLPSTHSTTSSFIQAQVRQIWQRYNLLWTLLRRNPYQFSLYYCPSSCILCTPGRQFLNRTSTTVCFRPAEFGLSGPKSKFMSGVLISLRSPTGTNVTYCWLHIQGQIDSCIAAGCAGVTQGVTGGPKHCPYQTLWRHLLGSCILHPAWRKEGTQWALALCDLQLHGPSSGAAR